MKSKKISSTIHQMKGVVCLRLIRRRILHCVSFFSICLIIFTVMEFLKILPWQSSVQLKGIPNVIDQKGADAEMVIPSTHAPDDFRYRPRQGTNNSEVGEVLETAESYRDLLDRPLRSAIELTKDNAKDFIFVTASDNKYFHSAMDAIGNVQRLFPNRTIIFYDLEENKLQTDIVKILNLCGVIYRKFDFTKYPNHCRKLHNYAWKPIIIAEVLNEYPVLFWIDSSIRFLSTNFTKVFQQAIENGGIVTFRSAPHTIFPATHPGMYRYLPIPKAMAIKVLVREAGHIYVARTRDIYANVVRWWAACALVEPCIAPTMKRDCAIRVMNVYADCHRFDQSAFNILLANHFVYDVRPYSYANITEYYRAAITAVRRGSRDLENVASCLPNGQKQFQQSKEYFG